jgi:hypothetical protein
MIKSLKSLLAPALGLGLIATAVSQPSQAQSQSLPSNAAYCTVTRITLTNQTSYARTARLWGSGDGTALAQWHNPLGKVAISTTEPVLQGGGKQFCDLAFYNKLAFAPDARVTVAPGGESTVWLVSNSDQASFNITGLGEDMTKYAASQPLPLPSWYLVNNSSDYDTRWLQVQYSNTGGSDGYFNNGQMNFNLWRVWDGSSSWQAPNGTNPTLTPYSDWRRSEYQVWNNRGRLFFRWYTSGPTTTSTPN